MKNISSCVILSLFFTAATWANSSDYLCPSISEIKDIGLDRNSIFNYKGHYIVSEQNYYHSPYLWNFRAENITATNDDDAFNKANLALNTLSGDPQPEYANGYIFCIYNNQYGYLTQAFTNVFLSKTLTIKPDHPEKWDYVNASIYINQKLSMIGNGITVAVTDDNTFSLADVVAMNVHPKIDASCLNIQSSEGAHQLLFELNEDWLIHCQYS